MGKFQDLTGKTFGKLTVINFSQKEGKKIKWKCRCDCGNETVVNGENLVSGHTKSCGCIHKKQTSIRSLKDMTDLKFGMLTVIKRYGSSDRKATWLCKCDCGHVS